MIIGISGKKQHGKDTVANIIQLLTSAKDHPFFSEGEDYSKLSQYSFEVYSPWKKRQFANKLKQIVALIIGCDIKQLEDNDFKEKPLGGEWKVWFWTHYKYPVPRITQLFMSQQEAIDYRVEGKTVIEHFGTAAKISSCQLTPRLLLQLMGTDCGRQIIHPNIWVNATMADYKLLHKKGDIVTRTGKATINKSSTGPSDRYIIPAGTIPGEDKDTYITTSLFEYQEMIKTPTYSNWIITDVRFPNEVQAIKDRGGLVFRVNRVDVELSKDQHESETALDSYTDWDGIILNSTMDVLIGQVQNYLYYYKLINYDRSKGNG